MRFSSDVEVYRLNDDGTVTIKCGNVYYRCKMKMPIYFRLSQLDVENTLVGRILRCEFGLYKENNIIRIQLIDFNFAD